MAEMDGEILWLDRPLANEIDLKTFKTGNDVLFLEKMNYEDIANC